MIGLICALKCEAQKIIERFKLQAVTQNSAYPVYSDGTIFLIISGLGKMRAAAAAAYLYAITGERPFTGWVNIGIGGHPIRHVGEGCCAHQVIDVSSGQRFYPTFTWKHSLPTETILTVDQPEKEFVQRGVYEMEASGFCSAVFNFTIAELIHCYKVISDNRHVAPKKDEGFVAELIGAHLDLITALIENLQDIQRKLCAWTSVNEQLKPFVERWRFTATELFQLKHLLQRWESLSSKAMVLDEQLEQCKRAKDVIICLDRKLQCFL